MTSSKRIGSKGPKTMLGLLGLCGLLLASACGGGGSDDTADGTSSSTTETSTEGTYEGPGPAPRPLAEPVKLKVGLSSRIEAFASVLLADQLGEFEKENLDVELVFAAPADTLQQLGLGDLDAIASVISAGTVNAVNGGLDVKAIAPLYHSSTGKDGLWLRNDLVGAGADELRGIKVGSTVGAGSSTALAISRFLADNGVGFDEVEVQTLPAADISLAFENGAVDAAWLNSPAWIPVDEAGFATQVAAHPDGFSGHYLYGPSILDGDPEVGQAFVRALLRTTRTYLQGDYKADSEVLEALSAVLEIEEDAVLATPSLVFDEELFMDLDAVEDVQRAWIEFGELVEIDEPLPTDQLVDSSFLEAVLAER